MAKVRLKKTIYLMCVQAEMEEEKAGFDEYLSDYTKNLDVINIELDVDQKWEEVPMSHSFDRKVLGVYYCTCGEAFTRMAALDYHAKKS